MSMSSHRAYLRVPYHLNTHRAVKCAGEVKASVKYCQLSLFGIILASLDFETIKVGMVSTTPLGVLLLVSLVSVASAQEQIFR